MTLATTTELAPLTLAATDLGSYLPLFVMVLSAATFGVMNIVLSQFFGPRRAGEAKGVSYESGMTPVDTARKRFNVRFYLIAMVFLVFDVEVVFLYPWAISFANLEPGTEQGLVWLFRILFFLLTTVVAYLYGFRKGVFRFD